METKEMIELETELDVLAYLFASAATEDEEPVLDSIEYPELTTGGGR